ncbi:MAG TPA: 2Fe-2S iron-sulfur cluster-binding protein, partial [Dehalococcoidia bacterium]|nr:2Fe-2S iron-sulfur cluster-binding protein [Dehalococcoidia bacterium]
METVTITIDGQLYTVEKGIPLVLAAERAGIRIPHLCY